MKIQLTCDALKNISTKYVMGVDSFDAIIINNPEKTIPILQKSDHKLIFNATSSVNCSLREHIDEFERIYPNEYYCYLNAGAWVGETEFCKKFFSTAQIVHQSFHKVLKEHHIKTKRRKWCKFENLWATNLANSEEIRIKHTFFKMCPGTGIDTHCEIFQNLCSPIHSALIGEEQGIEIKIKSLI
jgi:hypothetical protein